MHCSHHTDLLLYFLKFGLWPVCEYRKNLSPDFWRKLFRLFSFSIYSLFFIQCIFLHIFCNREGPDLGIFGGRNQKGEIWGSNLGANYDSANNSQKKGVPWYRCSSKIDKIPEKYIWRSSSSVNEYVESLQRVTLFKL